MASYAFTLPFCLADDDAQVLIAERCLIQKRSGGRPVTGIIPEWAGQWGLIGSPIASGETAEGAAIRSFREQTGIDMADKDAAANFMMQNRTLLTLKTEQYTPFNVLCVFMAKGPIELLQSVLSDTIGTEQVSEDLLSESGLFTVSAARKKLGPCPPPPNGWRAYLVQNYFGGQVPGQFNTTIETLTTSITKRAAQDDTFFATALADKAPS